MGMFDTIYLSSDMMEKLIVLGYPNKDKNDFQTKDLYNYLEDYGLGYTRAAPDGTVGRFDFNKLIKKFKLKPYVSLDKETIWLESPYHGNIEIHNIVYDTYYSYILYFQNGDLVEIKQNKVI